MLVHAVAILLLDEKLGEARGRHVGGDVQGKHAEARLVDGVLVQIGGVDLEGNRIGGLGQLERFGEDHGERVGLFARRAARHPRPHHAAGGTGGDQRRQGEFRQLLPGRRVPEKSGHADQQFLEQDVQLLGVLLQIADVGFDLVHLMDTHAAFDAAVQRAPPIQGEIMAGAGAQQDHYFLQRALGFFIQGKFGFGEPGHMAAVGDEFARQFVHRTDDVCQPRLDRAARHGVELRGGRILHQNHAGFFLDGAEAQRAVAAHARKNDAGGTLVLVFGEGTEKGIDRQAQAADLDRDEQVQRAVKDREVAVGRNHIHVVGPDVAAIRDFHDLHRGGALKQLGHHALLRRIEMLNDHEGHAAIRRRVLEKLRQRLQPSGGGADTHDDKCALCGLP